MLRWRNPEGVGCDFEFQFARKDNPSSISKLEGTPAITVKEQRAEATLTFQKEADVAELEKYYARVRAVPKAGKQDQPSAWVRETVWNFNASLALEVAGREIDLYSDREVDADLYEGDLDFTDAPVDLKTLTASVLHEFDLDLPAQFPSLTFYAVSGKVRFKAPKYVRFQAWTEVKFPDPFGLSKQTLTFKDLKLGLELGTDTRSAVIAADVLYGDGQSGINFGNALIVLGKTYVVGLEIKQSVSPVEIIANMLGINIPSAIGEFLPVFSPESPDKPIRLYHASKLYEAPDKRIFKEGFNLDQLIIKVLKQQFHVSLQVINKKGFTLTAHAPKINLFDVMHIRSEGRSSGFEGPEIEVISADDTVKLKGELLFFPGQKGEKAIDFKFGYAQGLFSGDLESPEPILGVDHPRLSFEWGKNTDFRITHYPIDFGALEKAFKWAEEFQELGNKITGCQKVCDEITDLAFNEIIHTRFEFKYEMAPGKDKEVGVSLSGKYIVSVAGEEIAVDMDRPLTIYIRIPTGFSDMANVLLEALTGAVKSIVLCLWENKVQLGKLLLLLTFQKGIKSAAAAACRLGCQAGEDAMKAALEASIKAAAEAAEAIIVSGLETAAEAVVALTGLLKLLKKFVEWIAGKDKETKEAERKKAEAEDQIRSYLTVPSLEVAYKEDGVGRQRIHASWKDITQNPVNGEVTYLLRITGPNGSKDFPLGRKTLEYDISKSDFINGQEYNVSIRAVYNYNGTRYEGNGISGNVKAPVLQQPAPVVTLDWGNEAKKKLGVIDVAWTDVGILPAGLTRVTRKGYKVELHNLSTSSVVSQEITANTHQFKLYDDTDPEQKPFFPDPAHEYEVQVTAIATDPDLNSTPVSHSNKFHIPWGIGYMRIGYNFRIEKNKKD